YNNGFYFFFFQAEDGIRDRTVTGVQTCALPIYVAAKIRREIWGRLGLPVTVGLAVNKVVSEVAAHMLKPEPVVDVRPGDEPAFRSEERRVGKGGRRRWWADQYIKEGDILKGIGQ